MPCTPFVSLCCAEEYAGAKDVHHCSRHRSTQGGVLCLGPNPVPISSVAVLQSPGLPSSPDCQAHGSFQAYDRLCHESLICLEMVWKQCS